MSGERRPPIEGRLTVQAEPATIHATGVVSLTKVADQEKLSVSEQIALQDAELRKDMAQKMLRVFGWANAVTLIAVAFLVLLDEFNIGLGLAPPGDRIINHQVILALLGATTAQVGTIAVIIARYLFPGRA